MPLFDVWDATRQKKSLNALNDSCLNIKSLITKASEKLKIKGTNLVLELTGSPVDEDDILQELKRTEILILLQDNETWSKPSALQEIEPIDSHNSENGGQNSVQNDTTHCTSMEIDNPVSDNQQNKENSAESQNSTPVNQRDEENCNESSSSSPSIVSPRSVSLFANFVVPWQKIDSETLAALTRGSRDENVIRTTVHLIIAEMRHISLNIKTTDLKKVARQMIRKYPDSFEDRLSDGKTRFGEGIYTIYTKLRVHAQERNTRDNRQKKLEDVLPALRNHQLDESSHDENSNSTSNDVVENQPTELENYLQLLHSYKDVNITQDQLITALKGTFSLQKKFFTKKRGISIESIKEAWPCLFTKALLFEHFFLLTGKK
ncbi:hypothetical protein QAD02_019745 [Eretmocerus hayati]|uniref:Uncharacterized protein n=1 Tax=Eretmocerus hayati TaxID=131215 RepID=A0ACC2PLN1_9HYME|nr:hypothetical protein QAD02_019745 [Eretmocerus hayati]